MTDTQQREAARQFFYKWKGRGKEDEDARSYWIDLFTDVLGQDKVTDRLDFEKKVLGSDGNTKRIDIYIPETHVLIEQKSLGIALDKPQTGHGGKTPYEQAKEYDNGLIHSEKARWIITSNFAEIWIYNMEEKAPVPTKIHLDELPSKYRILDFLINKEQKKITDEMQISLDAGNIVGALYDEFLKQYDNPNSDETLKSLNKLCVRIVFCLYAEDSGIFGAHQLFNKYMSQFDAKTARKGLRDLFRVLNEKPEERDKYLKDDDPILASFPYVNGGLFEDDDIDIPPFTDKILDLVLRRASDNFDWSDISPTIFGAVFESTLNQETRRKGGMHYTSIENIHKVIDPLFLSDLQNEFDQIRSIAIEKERNKKLHLFQDKLASLEFLDPAAGSGNFLTESFLSLRRLEHEVLKLFSDQIQFVTDATSPIKVNISQFHGIEINDFAVTVAKTALWIAEIQMKKETEAILRFEADFLPLQTNANIVEGNALRLDWKEIVDPTILSYIMGNPPFIGYSLQSKSQKEDILSIYVNEKGRPYKTAGKIDYVAGWYWKSAEYMQGTQIRTALVSTNSITQGEQVASVWKPLYERFDIHIDFAYRTFIWDSEANDKAHVHCVIIGFSYINNSKGKIIYDEDKSIIATNINPYLIDAENVFIDSSTTLLCDVPQMTTGNRPSDGGHLIIEPEDYPLFVKKEPSSIKYIKKLVGSVEFINNKPRYCLWLVKASPKELLSMPMVLNRIEDCKKARLSSPDAGRRKLADTPHLFRETYNPNSYILIPKVSSERRRYIPMGFLDGETISTDLNFIIPDATLYHFGVLTSNVHMSWMRAVCGRLKSDYRYSKDIVYNNFPWPNPTEEQKAEIEKTAQGILNAREKYPDSSFADMYGEHMYLYPELVKAHQANDVAVMKAYGLDIKTTTEADCVAHLMKLYQQLTKKETAK